jgi:hypothetical protein
MGQNKGTFGDRRSRLMVTTRQIFGTEQDDFLGKEKLILGLNEMNYGT